MATKKARRRTRRNRTTTLRKSTQQKLTTVSMTPTAVAEPIEWLVPQQLPWLKAS